MRAGRVSLNCLAMQGRTSRPTFRQAKARLIPVATLIFRWRSSRQSPARDLGGSPKLRISELYVNAKNPIEPMNETITPKLMAIRGPDLDGDLYFCDPHDKSAP
jgi:hypothetical protein